MSVLEWSSSGHRQEKHEHTQPPWRHPHTAQQQRAVQWVVYHTQGSSRVTEGGEGGGEEAACQQAASASANSLGQSTAHQRAPVTALCKVAAVPQSCHETEGGSSSRWQRDFAATHAHAAQRRLASAAVQQCTQELGMQSALLPLGSIMTLARNPPVHASSDCSDPIPSLPRCRAQAVPWEQAGWWKGQYMLL